MGPSEGQAYRQIKAAMLRNRIPVVPLTRDNFSQHIPNVNLPEGNEALVDVGAGILYADRALKTVRVWLAGTQLAGPGCAEALMRLKRVDESGRGQKGRPKSSLVNLRRLLA